MADIAAHADMKMMISVFRVRDDLDDCVLVEVVPDEGGDVHFRPGLQRGVVARAEMNNEVREVPSLVEAATVCRGDLSAEVVAVECAEWIDPVPVDPGAVFSEGILGPTGADRLVFVLADEIVGLVSYNTYGSVRGPAGMTDDCRATLFYPSRFRSCRRHLTSLLARPPRRLCTLEWPVISTVSQHVFRDLTGSGRVHLGVYFHVATSGCQDDPGLRTLFTRRSRPQVSEARTGQVAEEPGRSR